MTELLYLQDTYTFRGTATVIAMGDNEKGTYCILDRTIFYPQWGGQPSDQGTIVSPTGTFAVEKVLLDPEGTVYHFGHLQSGLLQVGDSVSLSIDGDLRTLNARNHSVGHLLDNALTVAGITTLSPTKGYHFPEGCYVEYTGTLPDTEEACIARLQTSVDSLIEKQIPCIVTMETPTDIRAPQGKTPRHVAFSWLTGCGCGGTHVRHTGEIGGVKIRKIKNKNGVIRISYECI